jgi:hypothetical protein
MFISTALLLDSNIRNSVCIPAKLPCRRVVEGRYYFYLVKLSSFIICKYCVSDDKNDNNDNS